MKKELSEELHMEFLGEVMGRPLYIEFYSPEEFLDKHRRDQVRKTIQKFLFSNIENKVVECDHIWLPRQWTNSSSLNGRVENVVQVFCQKCLKIQSLN